MTDKVWLTDAEVGTYLSGCDVGGFAEQDADEPCLAASNTAVLFKMEANS